MMYNFLRLERNICDKYLLFLFQGTGRSKKEAKIAGARRAFAALLDLDEEAFDTKFAGKNKFQIKLIEDYFFRNV